MGVIGLHRLLTRVFVILSDNAVFRPILPVNLLCVQYTLGVYTVTKDSPETNLILRSDSYIYWSLTVQSPDYRRHYKS